MKSAKASISADFNTVIDRLSVALQNRGFDVLTRIDMHSKIEEKIGKIIPKVVILGACNPTMAYESYIANPDVASLLPCNAVIRDLENGQVSVEIIKASAMMKILGDKNLEQPALKADSLLAEALRSI